MDNKIINGRKLAFLHQQKLEKVIRNLKTKPKVVSILIGDNPQSLLYTHIKQNKAQELGIDFQPLFFESSVQFNEIAQKITELNLDQSVTGIMVQLPLPEEFLKDKGQKELLNLIDPKKDIDGLTGRSNFWPAAVRAVLSILEDENILVKGKKVVVVGASDLVGKPMAKILTQKKAAAKICDSSTYDLKKETLDGDIVISATGVSGLIKGDMIKKGAVVIDVGTQKLDGKVLGDVDFATVLPKASKITPVPGGVGPMTVISLMENVTEAFRRSHPERS